MGKIYYLMGKSSAGKDSIYRELGYRMPHLRKVVPYTTRPIREGEKNGVEYFFVDEEKLAALEAEGKVIELRAYDTVHGVWKYFTVDDGQIVFDEENYMMIGTLESYAKVREYYGEDKIVPIYLEVEDGERLFRALMREWKQKEPKYKEMCRRYLADEEDFSEDKLRELGIYRRFENKDMEACLDKIMEVIAHE